jgi:pilus assembly protein Flp/PilA
MMRSFGVLLRRLCSDESGATAIEYALIAAGIGATVAATVYNLGSAVKTTLWDKIGSVF